MASKDLYNEVKVSQCVAAASLTATTTGTAVDTAGYEGVTFAINVGTGLDETNYFTATLVEGDASNSLTNVETVDYLGASIDIQAAGAHKIGYRGNKRYVAVKLTETGTATAPVSVTAVLSSPRVAPTV